MTEAELEGYALSVIIAAPRFSEFTNVWVEYPNDTMNIALMYILIMQPLPDSLVTWYLSISARFTLVSASKLNISPALLEKN
jgi:hypothetical protein